LAPVHVQNTANRRSYARSHHRISSHPTASCSRRRRRVPPPASSRGERCDACFGEARPQLGILPGPGSGYGSSGGTRRGGQAARPPTSYLSSLSNKTALQQDRRTWAILTSIRTCIGWSFTTSLTCLIRTWEGNARWRRSRPDQCWRCDPTSWLAWRLLAGRPCSHWIVL